MNKHTAFISALVVTTGVALAATAMPASAVTFGFNNIAGGDTVGDQYNSNFSIDVSQSSTNTVLFKFLNTSANSNTSALKQFVFSANPTVSSLLSNMQVNVGNVGTVKFANDITNQNSKIQNLSQSNLVSGWNPIFGGGTDGGNNNSVQSGEVLGVSFNGNYNDVITALKNGNLSVGIHVGSLPNGNSSDTYVTSLSSTQSVPEPATIFGLMAFGMGGLLTKKNGKNAKKEVLPVKITV
ncbi:hypothetical protein NIES37_02080 [Tolypothrix tenuis PCC 7101]|uniref:PEP-CTERM protein-sorting domain-containing protein n=1 Tax=Tolypothrix tenuis PCC 7101 TaxID=231146 RepID=A0A1Z4MS39_9CYAN|nr:PEP-CTERM sorting domain-containing protein [Aulosira sp. FACHB-113]BAY96278.1 hypothetical protein NIES37_02080 [Tolypothrix tenuis PCC 7101]BAZ73215.1 hypothetical protein NIES50_17760 [Aulosira laxa NIES-50]